MRIAAIAIAFALCGCGSSDSTAPDANISGRFTLQSANGHALPTSGRVPIYGDVQIIAGSGTIDRAIVSFAIVVATSTGNPGATATFQQSGVVSGSGWNYTFKFADGTDAIGICSTNSCNVIYDGTSFLFARQ